MLAIRGITAPRFFAHLIELKMDHVPIGKTSSVSGMIIVRIIYDAIISMIV